MQIIQGGEEELEDQSNHAPFKTLVITGSSDAVVVSSTVFLPTTKTPKNSRFVQFSQDAENLVLDLIAKAPPLVSIELETPRMNEDTAPDGATLTDHSYYDRFPRSTSSFQNGLGIQATRFPVPKTAVGLIIGKGGETIRKIRRDTGAKVQFNPLTGSAGDAGEQIATVVGRPGQIRHAVDLINELVDTAMKSAYPNDQTEAIQRKNFTKHFISPNESDSDYDDQWTSPEPKTDSTLENRGRRMRPRLLSNDNFRRYDSQDYASSEEAERLAHFRSQPRETFKVSSYNYAKVLLQKLVDFFIFQSHLTLDEL